MGYMRIDATPEAKYLCDTLEDLSILLPRPGYGDTCWVISEACEYIYNSKGEWLPKNKTSVGGDTKVDLTGYATEDFVQEQIQNIQHPVVEVPSKLSELENDANYVQQAYVDTKVANLVNSAPETLDTIGEIAQALKEHQDVADAITKAIGEKADKEDLPSVEGLASEAFVTEAIQKIEFPVTDLSNYYTKDEVTQAIIDNAELPAVNDAHMQLVTDAEGNKVWEDKLCYNYRVDYEVYAETTIPEGKGGIMPEVDVIEPIVKNESYIVTWDGVEYPCIAYAREGSDFGTVLGNEYLVYTDQSELDNGLPFLFIGFYAHEVMKLVYAADKNGHVFSVKGSKQTNTVIPGQYIAGGVYAGTGSQSTIIGDPLTAAAPGNGSVSLGGVADGVASVAEGNGTTHSDSQCAHAEGSFTHAYGWVSHVEGYGNTAYRMQHVQGRRAVEDSNSIYADIVGNGSQDGNDRSNAYALDWYGNAYFDGDVFVQGDGKTLNFDGAKKVATEEYVDTKVAELVDNAPETLNTLKEVADALNENASTAEALNQAIGSKVDKTDYPESTNPNQYLTTDAKGNKIWENKLAYSSLETIPFIEEMTWTGAETSFPMAIANAQAGDKITIFIDDIPYYGILEDGGSTTWLVKFDEDYEQTWIKTGQFYISKLGYNMSLGGVPLAWAVGKMSATVTTNIVHPIDNKYLGLNITQGTGDLSMSINGEAEDASGYKALSLNGGFASGNLSVAIGSSAVASGTYALAAGNGSAKANYSVAFGEWTDSVTDNSMTIGTHNVTDENKEYLFIVGNGSKGEFNPQTGYQRTYSNAHTVNKDGTGWFQKEIKVGGTSEHDENAKKLATEEYVEERYLQNETAFNELADTVKGLDKYCAFMKQGDQIKLGNVQEYSKMQEMLNGTNKFHATLAISYVNEEGLLISETCYAKNVMSAINMETGDKPYVSFGFETFNGETIKFRWNADNTISNIVTIAAISAEEAEV